jgi:hypothetical protein
MDSTWLNGHQVPVIDPGQVSHLPGPDFAQRNEELQGSMGTQGGKSGDEEDMPMRKSELVEIPTASARPIYRIQAIFPFDLVPDELVIDELKVSIIYKQLLSSQVNNILIKDITDIVLDNALFFGALLITGGEYEGAVGTAENERGPLTISKLRREEAHTARRIILGLMILSDQKVDTTKMSVREIYDKTIQLGKD